MRLALTLPVLMLASCGTNGPSAPLASPDAFQCSGDRLAVSSGFAAPVHGAGTAREAAEDVLLRRAGDEVAPAGFVREAPTFQLVRQQRVVARASVHRVPAESGTGWIVTELYGCAAELNR